MNKERRIEKSMESITKHEKWSLEGSTALVTGGSKGIGRAIVEALAGFGVKVHTCSRHDLSTLLDEWRRMNLQVTGSVCDVSNLTDREKLMEEVSSIFEGKLNILVNNVGGGGVKPAVEITTEEYYSCMALNFDSCFHLSQLAYPLLKASGRGNVVNISSMAGIGAIPNCAHYGSAKGAMIQLTRTLACEWANDMIRVNCIAPGVTRTPLAQWMTDDKELSEKVLEKVPLKRFGEPDEVAAVAAFLACLLLLLSLAKSSALMVVDQLILDKQNFMHMEINIINDIHIIFVFECVITDYRHC